MARCLARNLLHNIQWVEHLYRPTIQQQTQSERLVYQEAVFRDAALVNILKQKDLYGDIYKSIKLKHYV